MKWNIHKFNDGSSQLFDIFFTNADNNLKLIIKSIETLPNHNIILLNKLVEKDGMSGSSSQSIIEG